MEDFPLCFVLSPAAFRGRFNPDTARRERAASFPAQEKKNVYANILQRGIGGRLDVSVKEHWVISFSDSSTCDLTFSDLHSSLGNSAADGKCVLPVTTLIVMYLPELVKRLQV